jgi:hypothetical protein
MTAAAANVARIPGTIMSGLPFITWEARTA